MGDGDHESPYDVVIVGAGPAGAACATLLAQHGRRVLLCDRARFPREKVCGATVNPACWPAFERLGVADEIKSAVQNWITSISIINQRTDVIAVTIDRSSSFFALSRSTLDGILVDAARRAGATFLDGTSVVGIEWSGSWRVRLRHPKRAAEVRARYLIGADGRNSVVARQLHRIAPFSSWSPGFAKRPTRIGLSWRTHGQAGISNAVHMYFFETGYCGVVNLSDESANIAMVTTPELAREASVDFGGFIRNTLYSNRLAAARFVNVEPIDGLHSANPIDPRRNTAPAGLRDLPAALIGDARQTVEPFTGEGIGFALEDGIVTAERLIGWGGRGKGPGFARFRVNHVFSPLLRNRHTRESLVSIGSMWASAPRWVARHMIQRSCASKA